MDSASRVQIVKMIEALTSIVNLIVLTQIKYCVFIYLIFIFCLFCPFRAAPVAYEGSQAGVASELLLLAYATATRDPSCSFDLHHSSQQCRILNPLSEATNRTLNLMVLIWIGFR